MKTALDRTHAINSAARKVAEDYYRRDYLPLWNPLKNDDLYRQVHFYDRHGLKVDRSIISLDHIFAMESDPLVDFPDGVWRHLVGTHLANCRRENGVYQDCPYYPARS